MPGVTAEEQVRDFTRCCLRSGLLDDNQLLEEVAAAIRAELPERAEAAEETAEAWLSEERDALVHDQAGWPEATDYDRLQSAFAELETLDVVVLQGVEDHWAAKAELDRAAAAGTPATGIAWFTPPDVWHALDRGMFEVNLWHGTTANVAPGDALLDEVLVLFDKHGLPACFDEGRIEVSARWQRRVAGG